MPRPRRQTVVISDSDVGGIIHVANIKGGVGKSTVATNLASALARRGRTLVVDLDVQGSATVAFGAEVGRHAHTSYELFRRRFAYPSPASAGPIGRATRWYRTCESAAFGWLIGHGDVTSVATNVDTNLDLIPAGPELFKPIGAHELTTIAYNLALCRRSYKYVVLDTPSAWNELIRRLYRLSDLNLVPVTLNALSTKSLRDYLHSVKRLAQKHRSVRVRIIKNEVYGKAGAKLRGKTRTMSENRAFLERLCEQVVVQHESSLSLVPQTILLDLEIPETAVVRDAQDEGVTVSRMHQYSSVAKAFDALGCEVQHVLNNYATKRSPSFWERRSTELRGAATFAAAAMVACMFLNESAVEGVHVPRPVAPQEVAGPRDEVIECTLGEGQSLYRLAKYAICRFRAKVPSMEQLNAYVLETIRTHNRTRMPGEDKIENIERIAAGTVLRFYPPMSIMNPSERQLRPVYDFFTSLVDDPYAYITGDWCERGEGGGTPHYGIDIAGTLGADILSPVDGVAVAHYSSSFGRTVGVVNGNMVVFFSHLGQVSYKTGDKVTKGSKLGTIGMSGRTSGPHVHIGYGVRTFSGSGVRLGKARYRLTDPKLFFYREVFLDAIED